MRIFLALLILLAPGSPWALSCQAPNPAQSIDHLLRNGTRFDLLVGVILPTGGPTDAVQGDERSARYEFHGHRLTPNGSDMPAHGDIVARTQCISIWCGDLPEPSTEGLFLVRPRDDGAYSLVLGACGGGIFAAPNAQQADVLRSCLRVNACGVDAQAAFRAH